MWWSERLDGVSMCTLTEYVCTLRGVFVCTFSWIWVFYRSVSSITDSKVTTLNSRTDESFWFGGPHAAPAAGDRTRWDTWILSCYALVLTNEGDAVWSSGRSGRPPQSPWHLFLSSGRAASLWTRVTPCRSFPAREQQVSRSPGLDRDWSGCWMGRGLGSLWTTSRRRWITS